MVTRLETCAGHKSLELPSSKLPKVLREIVSWDPRYTYQQNLEQEDKHREFASLGSSPADV